MKNSFEVPQIQPNPKEELEKLEKDFESTDYVRDKKVIEQEIQKKEEEVREAESAPFTNGDKKLRTSVEIAMQGETPTPELSEKEKEARREIQELEKLEKRPGYVKNRERIQEKIIEREVEIRELEERRTESPPGKKLKTSVELAMEGKIAWEKPNENTLQRDREEPLGFFKRMGRVLKVHPALWKDEWKRHKYPPERRGIFKRIRDTLKVHPALWKDEWKK